MPLKLAKVCGLLGLFSEPIRAFTALFSMQSKRRLPPLTCLSGIPMDHPNSFPKGFPLVAMRIPRFLHVLRGPSQIGGIFISRLWSHRKGPEATCFPVACFEGIHAFEKLKSRCLMPSVSATEIVGDKLGETQRAKKKRAKTLPAPFFLAFPRCSKVAIWELSLLLGATPCCCGKSWAFKT